MEPTADRRDTGSTVAIIPRMSSPQWSPPSSAGVATPEHVQLDRERHAAMEPATGRREHGSLAYSGLSRRSPQWSPPSSGGSTARRSGMAARPSWSHNGRRKTAGGRTVPGVRPGHGGYRNGARRRAAGARCCRTRSRRWTPGCRNGARRLQRREHAAGRGLPATLDGAAMEPAAERREHLARRSRAAKVKFAAWSPPSNSGSTAVGL